MIYIFHGENLSHSRDLILKFRRDFAETKKLSSKTEILIENTTPQQLSDTLSSFDFFSNPPFIVLDISNVGRSNTESYVEVLRKMPQETFLIILSSKELTKSNTFIKAAAELKAKVVVSKKVSDSNVFNFIDSVFSGNRELSYKNLKDLVNDDQDNIYILTMLEYALRNIAYVKFNSPMLNKINPFVKYKAINQSKFFSESSIRNLYEFFYEIDIDSKTGGISDQMLIPICIEKVQSELKR